VTAAVPVDERRTLTLPLAPGRAFRFILVCIAVLVVLHALAVAAGLWIHDRPYAYRMIHLDSEVSVGTWFAQVLWLAGALLLGVMAAVGRRVGDRWWRHWLGLSALAVYLSIDEGAALHEQATPVVRRVTGLSGGVFGPTWIIAAAAVGLVVLAVYARFLVALPARTRNLLLLGGAVAVAGAAGAEIGNVVYAASHSTRSIGYHALAGMEEALEKLGVGIAVVALLDHVRRHVAPLAVVAER
jgi:hypothetical protein